MHEVQLYFSYSSPVPILLAISIRPRFITSKARAGVAYGRGVVGGLNDWGGLSCHVYIKFS